MRCEDGPFRLDLRKYRFGFLFFFLFLFSLHDNKTTEKYDGCRNIVTVNNEAGISLAAPKFTYEPS